MGPLECQVVVGVGLVAGGVDAVVGSGSLLTFPALPAGPGRHLRHRRHPIVVGTAVAIVLLVRSWSPTTLNS